MREIILSEYPTLGHLIGSLNTADAVTCGLCGKNHKHTHDKDCSCHEKRAGDCNCDPANEILEVAGLRIVNACCGPRLMEIIACSMPQIAKNIAPLFRKYSALISNIANRIGAQEQWCVFGKKENPVMLGILTGIISSRGYPELLIMGMDEKMYQYNPAGDLFFILFKDRNSAFAEYQKRLLQVL